MREHGGIGHPMYEASSDMQTIPDSDPTVNGDEQAPKLPTSRKAALAAGLKFYETGKACRNGHVSKRYVVGAGNCVECALERSRKQRETNKDAIKEYNKVYHKDHHKYDPDKAREYYRKRMDANPEEMREIRRKWAKANPDKIKAKYRRWREAYPGKAEDATRRWREANPGKTRAQFCKRRARLLLSGTHYTGADVREIMKAQRGRCVYCKADLRKARHVDHIVPLSKGGSNSRSNIQLTCPTCNHRKGAMDPADFARKIGMLL